MLLQREPFGYSATRLQQQRPASTCSCAPARPRGTAAAVVKADASARSPRSPGPRPSPYRPWHGPRGHKRVVVTPDRGGVRASQSSDESAGVQPSPAPWDDYVERMQATGEWDTLSKPSTPRAPAARPQKQQLKPSAASADALLAAIVKQHRLPREWNELQHWSKHIGLYSSREIRKEAWKLCKQQLQAQQQQPAAVTAQGPSIPPHSADTAATSASSGNASRSRSRQASADSSSSTEPDTILLAAVADMWPLMAAAMPDSAAISPDSTSNAPSSTGGISSVRRRTRRPQKQGQQQPVARAARAAAVALSAVMTVLAPETATLETATAATAAVFSNPWLSPSRADPMSTIAAGLASFSGSSNSSSITLDPTAALKTLPASPIDTTTTTSSSSSSSSSALIPSSTISRLGPTRVSKATSTQPQIVRVMREAVPNNTPGLFDGFGPWRPFSPNMELPDAFCMYEFGVTPSVFPHHDPAAIYLGQTVNLSRRMQTYRNGMFQVGLALAQGDITPDTPDREVARRYKGEATKHRYLQQLQADGHGLHIRWKLVDDIVGASDGEQQLLQQFDYAANSAKNGGRRTLAWLKIGARRAAPAA